MTEEITKLHKRHYEQFADGTVKDIEDEIPFDVPEGWAWCRLRNIGEYKKGPFGSSLTKSMFVPKSENTVKVYEQKNAIQKDYSLGEYYITRDYFESQMQSFEVFPGDILVSCAGTIGETYILPDNIEQGIINQALMKMKITSLINTDYFLMFFDHILKEESANNGKGTAIKNIPPFDIFKNFLFPLPSYSEQKRIIESVNNIFSIIDNLENNKSDLQSLIKNTKSKILDLAIHGKLVPQDPNDEPAEELLKRIATSDNRPYKKFEEEEPFEIPSNWSWCFLDDICSKIKRGKSPKYVDKSTIMAFAQKCNQKDGPTSLDKALYIDETTLKKYPEEEKMQFNDIVINSTGTGTLGRVGIFNCSIPNDVNAVYPDSHVTTVRILPEIDKLYCYYFIKNKQSYLETMGEGSTNQKELKPDTISSLCFPLPPYPEQKRIVFKIEELFSSLETIVSNLD